MTWIDYRPMIDWVPGVLVLPRGVKN